MSIPVPPRIVRRVIRDPLWVPGCIIVILLMGLLSLPFLFVAPFTKRRSTLRLLRIGIASVWLDAKILMGCWRLWFRFPPWRREEQRWRDAHVELLGNLLHRYVLQAQRSVGLRMVEHLPDSLVHRDGPQLVLGRHAGPGDTLLVAYFVTHRMRRAPRVVLKRFLLLDAGIDVVLNRLGAYFLPPKRVPAAVRVQQLTDFAKSLRDHDAMLLFPEGGNWSPSRHVDDMAWALRNDRPEQAAWLEEHHYVLSPRAGGTQQVLAANAEVSVVIVTHYGLGRLHAPLDVWRALPLQEPIRIDAWSAPRPVDESVPGVQAWLDDHWAAINRWVVEINRAETAATAFEDPT